VERSAFLLPADLKPVWIPTKPITLCRSLAPSATSPGSCELSSQETETESGSDPAHLRGRGVADRNEMDPKRKPARPNRKQKRGMKRRRLAKRREREYEEKGLGEVGMAWKSRGKRC
jgi:hypothetical protein